MNKMMNDANMKLFIQEEMNMFYWNTSIIIVHDDDDDDDDDEISYDYDDDYMNI